MHTVRHALMLGGTVCMALLAPISRGAAQSSSPALTTLYSFAGNGGYGPNGSVVIGRGGVLYGATLGGGTSSACGPGCGTVFSLTPPADAGGAWAETVIHNFALGSGDGAFPNGVVMGADGVLYGTARLGGTSGDGIVFSLTPPAGPEGSPAGGPWGETVLYNFTDGAIDGGIPTSPLIHSRGVLYGTTTAGGLFGSGTVFALAPPAAGSAGGAWTETTIYNFTGAATGLLSAIGPDGLLYGISAGGGTGSACWDGCGSVFSLTPPAAPGGAWTESVLYNFTGPDGASPAEVVIGRDSILFGIATAGGKFGLGNVFSLIPPASAGGSWTEHSLHSYPKSGEFSYLPSSLVVSPNSGVLYGTTEYGGRGGDGTVFSLIPPSPGGAWTYTVLHEFTNGGGGAFPCCLAEDNGVIYGATNSGGTSGDGTAFALRP